MILWVKHMVVCQRHQVEEIYLGIMVALRGVAGTSPNSVGDRGIVHFPVDIQATGDYAVRLSIRVPDMQVHICKYLAGKSIDGGRERTYLCWRELYGRQG